MRGFQTVKRSKQQNLYLFIHTRDTRTHHVLNTLFIILCIYIIFKLFRVFDCLEYILNRENRVNSKMAYQTVEAFGLVRALLNSVQVGSGHAVRVDRSPLLPRSEARACAALALAGSGLYSSNMSAPLVPGQPQRTEFSHGPGHFAHPESDFQSHREFAFTQDREPLIDQYRDWVTDKRTDPTDPTSVGHEDQANLFVAGNPDTFGPGPALVKATKVVPSGVAPRPAFRTGVTREE